MLNHRELLQLERLIKKIDNPHEGLPKQVFNALVNIVPFLACELIVVNSKGQFLLTWRQDKYWRGWHFPGGLLRLNESFEERIQKTAWDELGISIESFEFLFPMNYPYSARGHGVSQVFICKTEMKPKDGKFFGRMPKGIIEEHKELWNKVRVQLAGRTRR